MTSQQPAINVELEHPYRPVRSTRFYLVTTVVAPTIEESERSDRPPLNLSFVVDRSGSMSGGKLDLARQGVEYAVSLLNRRDTISLVVYDDTVDLLLSQRKAGRDARDKAIRRLRRIQPRGSTALAEGWATGCAQLAPLADEDRQAICRSILLTDGLANVGETNPATLARDAGELAARGVTTTTFGVGDYFDEVLMAGMADSGRGRYHYIPDSAGIIPVFAGELGELLHVTMRDARFSLSLPSGWQARTLNDLPLETSRHKVTVELGDISSGDTRSVIWEVTAPAATLGDLQSIGISLAWKSADGTELLSERMTQDIETSEHAGPANSSVQDRLAVILGARARAEALEHNRAGRYDLAARAVQQVRNAMPSSAAGIEQMAELDAFSDQIAAPLSSAELKDHHFRSRRMSRSQKDYASRE
jgi:Ca-activated chloride channel homolog